MDAKTPLWGSGSLRFDRGFDDSWSHPWSRGPMCRSPVGSQILANYRDFHIYRKWAQVSIRGLAAIIDDKSDPPSQLWVFVKIQRGPKGPQRSAETKFDHFWSKIDIWGSWPDLTGRSQKGPSGWSFRANYPNCTLFDTFRSREEVFWEVSEISLNSP